MPESGPSKLPLINRSWPCLKKMLLLKETARWLLRLPLPALADTQALKPYNLNLLKTGKMLQSIKFLYRPDFLLPCLNRN